MKLKIRSYTNIKDAIFSILEKDQEYIILYHKFYKGKKVKKHNHPKVNEWVILDKGEVEFFYSNSWYNIKPKNEALVLKVDKGVVHGATLLSKAEYIVIRDGSVKTK
jgi:quercetin dioxygenase-like cupin family protein